MRATAVERFEAAYEPEPNTGCWLWTRHVQGDGYGTFTASGKSYLAHRWAYEHHRGPIPPGLEMDHLCRIRPCVNPWHLEAVTHTENLRRGMSPAMIAHRTKVCQRGHSEWALYSGAYQCRACRRDNYRAWYARRVEAGLCAWCPGQAVSGTCGACREKKMARRALRALQD